MKTKREQRLEDALQKIIKWNEFPETGVFWDDNNERQMSYSACYGSNGERDYMRKVAEDALIKDR